MLLFHIEIRSFSFYTCYISVVNSAAFCSAHPRCQVDGGVGLSGWVVWSFIFLFSCLVSHYYNVLLWFVSQCPVHVDISKLKWILLFPPGQCTALGVLLEALGLLLFPTGAAGGLWGSFCRWRRIHVGPSFLALLLWAPFVVWSLCKGVGRG